MHITETSVGSLWFNADSISFTLLFLLCSKLVLKTPCLSRVWRCLAEAVAGGAMGCGSGCSSLFLRKQPSLY